MLYSVAELLLYSCFTELLLPGGNPSSKAFASSMRRDPQSLIINDMARMRAGARPEEG